ncbi:glycosyltransferase family 2 protein [Flavobacterium gilvum]|uniref:Glycosyl transferase n=1 Tax=Flavobacterium gilvum TaxID=1492737 RepID=A0AAC9I1C1_9FLAO|nr:glycosyltransferase family A protein [Flavobacterium gilvum]AOW08116.1 glycosyl transferase [Flavobacterium gilvum]KFC58886.1 hypothetical protein FEM08_23740 [Flavobacterium gilvum]
MIVIYHKNSVITRVESADIQSIHFDEKKSIAAELMQLAIQFPESKLVWCHESYHDQINLTSIPELMHHDKMMFSYNPNPNNYLGNRIGYVEESPFINVNKKVTYPTWQMSSLAGVIHASALLSFKGKIKLDSDFDYYLNSVAKVGMPLGLFCYSEPKLLVQNSIETPMPNSSAFALFKFVKQHYKTRWTILLLLNMMVYEFRLPFLAFIYSLFFKNRNTSQISFSNIQIQSSKSVVQNATIDVIIPTIGRKKYLYDVLKDLSNQTHLPVNVIIVEQNPQENSVSELDYLQNEIWPFVIKNTFTNQAGACNARNLALNQVESEWIFMADDDIRIDTDFIEKGLEIFDVFGVFAITFGCYESNYKEDNKMKIATQWSSFGSGCSIVNTKEMEELRYDIAFEFGYGEDGDFGMQLRKKGVDIIYIPTPEILHLKAPIGGFRTKPELLWHQDKIQPKPSATVMLYKQLHLTAEQIKGYKTILFFKFYRAQNIKNPIRYFNNFQKQWKQSLYWANELKNKK